MSTNWCRKRPVSELHVAVESTSVWMIRSQREPHVHFNSARLAPRCVFVSPHCIHSCWPRIERSSRDFVIFR